MGIRHGRFMRGMASGLRLQMKSEAVNISGFKLTFVTLACAVFVLCNASCSRRAENDSAKAGKRVIVLGFDGMDPRIVRKLVAEGRLPNMAKLAANNGVLELQTSFPPQSPVAWSDFITGTNPGKHGIFDFIHRDPNPQSPEDKYLAVKPYFSTSETSQPEHTISIGKYIIPLSGSGMKLLRHGEAFWNVLESAGVPCTVFRVPSNFPPEESRARTFAGMGTPDLRGGYGSFSFFTDDTSMNVADITGGTVTFVSPRDGVVTSEITGPDNQFATGSPAINVPFTVYADADNGVARIDVQGKSILLNAGEWSGWVRLSFENIPHFVSTSGMVLFYVESLKPNFNLYVSPVNIDPAAPALPLTTPPEWSKELARKFGPFYTLGIAEDTKALDHGIFSDAEYLQQTGIYRREQRRIYRDELRNLKSGFLFYYFSDTDTGQHMFWGAMDRDETHPELPKRDARFRGTVYDIYRDMDGIVGEALGTLGPEDTLIVMSDHGFAPFRRAFHLDTWLKDHGYLKLLDGATSEDEFLMGVDWSQTKAYAIGFNGLYVNQAGREKFGIVRPGAEKNNLMEEIRKGLLAETDAGYQGARPISEVYRAGDVYSGENTSKAPDLLIGYNRGYRGSWETAIGKIPDEEIGWNKEKWGGDHLIDPRLVPGVIMTNRRITAARPRLRDIAPSVLKEFGVTAPSWMDGKPIF